MNTGQVDEAALQAAAPAEPEELVLAGGFPTAERDEWLKPVDGVLAKSGRIGADAALGAGFEKLVRATLDGIAVRPLYTADDAADAAGSGCPARPRSCAAPAPAGPVPDGWDVRQRHAEPDPAAARRGDRRRPGERRHARSGWPSATGGTAVADLPAVLDGVLPRPRPGRAGRRCGRGEAARGVPGARRPSAASPGRRCSARSASTRRPARPHRRRARRRLGRRRSPGGWRRGVPAGARRRRRRPAGARRGRLGRPGARLLARRRGGLPARAHRRRARRRRRPPGCWSSATPPPPSSSRRSRSCARPAGCGRGCRRRAARRRARPQFQHAVASPTMFTRRDPYVNLLRGTVAGFAAGVGGADAVTVAPFDAAHRASHAVLPADRPQHPGAAGRGGAPGAGDRPGRRLLVRRVAHRRAGPRGLGVLPGAGGRRRAPSPRWTPGCVAERVGGGAGAARAGRRHPPDAGDRRQRVPRPGREAGRARRRCPDRAGRRAAACTGRRRRSRRAATAPTRMLADTGARPRAFLATLGPLAAYTARAGFARNLLQAGGIETVEAGPTDDRRRGGGGVPRAPAPRSPCSARPTRSTPSAPRRPSPRCARPGRGYVLLAGQGRGRRPRRAPGRRRRRARRDRRRVRRAGGVAMTIPDFTAVPLHGDAGRRRRAAAASSDRRPGSPRRASRSRRSTPPTTWPTSTSCTPTRASRRTCAARTRRCTSTQPWTIRQYAGFSTADGVQRVLPAQPGRRAEGPVDRVRPGHPPRLRLRPPAGRRRRRHGRGGDRLDLRHAPALRRHPAGPDVGVDDHERRRAAGARALHRGRRGAGRAAREAHRDHPERHPQGVHGPQHLHLPAAAVDADHLRHLRLHLAGDAEVQLDLHLRLPHPGGRGDRRPGAGLHPGRRRGVPAGRASTPGWTSTRSRPGCRFFWAHRHELLHGGRQAAGGPAAVGQAGQPVRARRTRSRCRCARTARPRAGR